MAEYARNEHTPIIERGEGCHVYDTDGRRYLDGYAQMWCNVFGHCDPELNQAIKEQLDRIAHSSLFSASNVPAIELAAKLAVLTARQFGKTQSSRSTKDQKATQDSRLRGHNEEEARPEGSPLPHVFLSDNGSTAVEVALKMALQYQTNIGQVQRRKFLCFADAYHGDTAATMTLGGVELFRKAYEPVTFEVLRAPYPMCARPADGPTPEEQTAFGRACSELGTIFERHGKELAGAVIEPACQGAGGIRPMYPGYLKFLRELCDRHGVLLIADEILVAFGRCGAIFGSTLDGVMPDILCLAKGLTAGYLPLAATLASKRIYEAFKGKRADFRHFFHGHTFTGNQLGCAVALKTLELIESRNLLGHIAANQVMIKSHIASLERIPGIGRVRHCGMMIGIPLTAGPEGYASDRGQSVCAAALKRGTIMRALGDVLVLMPVLISGKNELAELFGTVEKAILGRK